MRGDMIEVYKILTNKYDSRVNFYLEKQQDSITRGHRLKLVNNRYHYDLSKFSFAPRIGHQYKLYVNHSCGIRKHFFAGFPKTRLNDGTADRTAISKYIGRDSRQSFGNYPIITQNQTEHH